MDSKTGSGPDRGEEAAAIAACEMPYAFILEDSIWCWDPRQRLVLFMMEDDERERKKCESFLKSRNRVFSSIEEVARYALGAGWPDSDKIVASYDGGFQKG